MMLKVSSVKYLHDYSLQVTFNDGKVRTVDLVDLVKKGGYYFGSLEDVELFKNVSMDDMNYSICWPNGADLSPDTLYEMGVDAKKSARQLSSKRRTRQPRLSVSSSPKSRAAVAAKSKG